jgi:hypothetical protein
MKVGKGMISPRKKTELNVIAFGLQALKMANFEICPSKAAS